MNELLKATKETVSRSTYPGYPEKRLVITDLDWLDNMTLPDGEWTASVSTFPTLDEQKSLLDAGYELDNFGRPLHPWLREMITDPQVGVVTGLGEYWHWGPNRAADPILINDDEEPKVLLIKRSDTGAWALPGGFIDDGESGKEAARRELCEEAGLILTGEPTEVYNGVVADARTTAHAWAETIAVLWRIHGTPAVNGNDDATDARWFRVNNLPDNTHGSHALLIEQAAAQMDSAPMANLLDLPSQIIAVNQAKGGHMGYQRLIATTKDESKFFIKSHDTQVFNYPIPQAHSLQYLHKEKILYDHIAHHDFSIIPSNVDLIKSHSLVMEALSPDDGWNWRAPNSELDAYIASALTALNQLQKIPLPESFHDTILPTYQTQIMEGWRAIDNISRRKIADKINNFLPRMRSDFQGPATKLIDDLLQLHSEFNTLSFPDKLYLTHHDFRQANIAWHPNHGTRIVDWSWAGAGRKNSDSTTLLIDLHKSGHDIKSFMDYFNDDHALTIIGFWLAHSLWPTRTADDSVRFHQVVSAVSAYDLLMKKWQR